MLGTLPISEQILDISASGKYLALLTSGALSIYDQNLTEYDVSDNTTGASSAVMRERTALPFSWPTAMGRCMSRK